MISGEESPSMSPGVMSGPSSASSRSAIVDVFLTAGHGLVWNADSARILREKCAVIGAMGGTLVQFRQQNVAKGLPLLLSPEEVRLALDNGWINLLAGGVEALNPELQERIGGFISAGNVQSHATMRKQEVISVDSDLQPQYRSKPQLNEHVVVSEDPVLMKRNSDVEAVDANLPHDNPNPISGTCATSKTRSAPSISGPVSEVADLSLPHVASELYPKYDPSSTVYTHKILVPLAGGLSRHFAQPLPDAGQHTLMSAVMSDLHSRGYRVTDGTKFGADYLAYPGDPSEFHSQYAVRVSEEEDLLHPMEILGGARVALGARKRFVIASGRGVMGSCQEASCRGLGKGNGTFREDVAQGLPTRDTSEDMCEVRVTASSSLPTDPTAFEKGSEEEDIRGRVAACEIDILLKEHQDVGGAGPGWASGGMGESASGAMGRCDVDIEYITLATDLDFVPRKMKGTRVKMKQGRGGRGRGGVRGRGGEAGRGGGGGGGWRGGKKRLRTYLISLVCPPRADLQCALGSMTVCPSKYNMQSLTSPHSTFSRVV